MDKNNLREDISFALGRMTIAWIGEVFFVSFSFITVVVISRLMGAKVLGLFSLSVVIVRLSSILARFGYPVSILRFVSFYLGKKENHRIKGLLLFSTLLMITVGLIFNVILFFLSNYIALNIFHKSSLVIGLKILSFIIPITSLELIWLRGLQGIFKIKIQVLLEKILYPLIRLLFIIAFYGIGLRLEGVLFAHLIAHLVVAVNAFYFLHKSFPFMEKIETKSLEVKRWTLFGLPLFSNELLNQTWRNMDIILLGWFLMAEDVGIYTAAVRLAVLIPLPLFAVNTVFAPMISKIYGQKEMDRLSPLYKSITKWIFSLSFPLFLTFALFKIPLMKILGVEFTKGATALVIIAAGQLINASVGSVGYLLTMTGRPYMNFINTIILVIFNFTFNYLLIPRYGLVGAAIAHSLSLGLINLMRLLQVYILVKIQPYTTSYLKPLFAGLITFAIIRMIDGTLIKIETAVDMLPALLLFVGIYILILIALRLSPEDRMVLEILKEKFKR
jgi:O-antigen/teichoic acid export membrane protein